jgi:hypothetical protein
MHKHCVRDDAGLCLDCPRTPLPALHGTKYGTTKRTFSSYLRSMVPSRVKILSLYVLTSSCGRAMWAWEMMATHTIAASPARKGSTRTKGRRRVSWKGALPCIAHASNFAAAACLLVTIASHSAQRSTSTAVQVPRTNIHQRLRGWPLARASPPSLPSSSAQPSHKHGRVKGRRNG